MRQHARIVRVSIFLIEIIGYYRFRNDSNNNKLPDAGGRIVLQADGSC